MLQKCTTIYCCLKLFYWNILHNLLFVVEMFHKNAEVLTATFDQLNVYLIFQVFSNTVFKHYIVKNKKQKKHFNIVPPL